MSSLADKLSEWRRLWSGRLQRMRLRPEEQLTIACADLLRLKLPADAFFFHPANEAVRSKASWAVQLAMGFMKGLPDFVIVWRGKVAFIELKRGRGKLTDNQAAFKLLCQRLAIPWEEARSVEDLDAILVAWGMIRASSIAQARIETGHRGGSVASSSLIRSARGG